MKLELEFGNRLLVIFLFLCIAFTGILFASAQSNIGIIYFGAPAPGAVPNPGHSSVDVVVNFSTGPCTGDNTLQQAIDNGCFAGASGPPGGGGGGTCLTYSTQNWIPNTGADVVSLLDGTNNLCTDDAGCTYRIWRVNSSDKGELMGKNAFPYRQKSDNTWLEGSSDNRYGTQGDSTSTKISDNWNQMSLYDDGALIPVGGGANITVPESDSLNQWILVDNSTSDYFILSICDF